MSQVGIAVAVICVIGLAIALLFGDDSGSVMVTKPDLQSATTNPGDRHGIPATSPPERKDLSNGIGASVAHVGTDGPISGAKSDREDPNAPIVTRHVHVTVLTQDALEYESFNIRLTTTASPLATSCRIDAMPPGANSPLYCSFEVSCVETATITPHSAPWLLWEPNAVTLAPSVRDQAVVFECRKDTLLRNYSFRVFDGLTGTPLQCNVFEARLVRSGKRSLVLKGCFNSGDVGLENIGASRTVEWGIGHTGYALCTDSDGTWRVSDRDDTMVVIDAHLFPGWSAVLEAIDTEGRAFPGIGFEADGVWIGSTDDVGRLILHRPSAPKSVGVATPGWRSVSDLGSLLGLQRVYWTVVIAKKK